jgi:peptidylprolyl isomerase
MKKIFLIAGIVMLFASVSFAQKRRTRTIRPKPAAPPVVLNAGAVKTASGLIYMTTRPGNGVQANVGDTVSVHYTGLLTDGTKFDSSKERGQPIEFQLGIGKVIKGWDEGIARMRVGEQAILVIPPSLGYGPRGYDVIPGGATLIFIVELVGVKGQ